MHPQGRFADVSVGVGLRADPRNGVEAVPYRITKLLDFHARGRQVLVMSVWFFLIPDLAMHCISRPE
jgi:hypothetical protein